MPWTFEQRVQRACNALIEGDLLQESEIATVHRPLFFGQYAFGLGFTPVREKWHQYDELKELIVQGLQGLDYHLQTNRRTLEFHIFSSDPNALRWVIKHEKAFLFNHLRRVDRSCWHLSLPRPKPKTKFYGEYGWRITMRDPTWGHKRENYAELERLSGEHKLLVNDYPKPGTFLYLKKLSDVLMFKLMHAEAIRDIEDRSTL